MEPNTRETTMKVKSMVMENLTGLTHLNTRGNLRITIFMAKVTTSGVMAELLKDNGNLIRCMVLEFSHGKMVEDMKVNTMMTRNKEEGCSIGLIVVSTMVLG